MTGREETYDFVVVGSGGGSAPAALVMKDAGKRVLIIEKESMIRLLHSEPSFSDRFISYMLSRNIRIDGIGNQGHWRLETPTVAEIEEALLDLRST